MKTVLIVDDEKLVRWALERGLQKEFTALTAASGEEALEVLDRVPVDALVTDLKMPGICGLELIRRARAKRSSLKILVLSAYASDVDRMGLGREGVSECIGKPFEVVEVAARLRRHLGDRVARN